MNDLSKVFGGADGVYDVAVEDMIINPRFVINQRAFGGIWSSLSTGDFGYDRWRKSSVASTIIQPIKDGNYEAGESYYLFGTGVTSEVLTAPSSGTWEIDVPDTATEVHLIPGTVEQPVRRRAEEEELQMCVPYYQDIRHNFSVPYAGAGYYYSFPLTYPEMIGTPTVVVTDEGGSGVVSPQYVELVSSTGLRHVAQRITSGIGALDVRTSIQLDAEL